MHLGRESLTGMHLGRVSLTGVYLGRVSLIGVHLIGIYLAGVWLIGVRLSLSEFQFRPHGLPLCWVACGGVLWCPRILFLK
jgi:hypothetical protein